MQRPVQSLLGRRERYGDVFTVPLLVDVGVYVSDPDAIRGMLRIRTVVTRVDLQPTRPEPDPVVMRGITLVPRHGTPVSVERVEARRRAHAPALLYKVYR